MTDASLPISRFAESDFRVGRVINRTASVFGRNFLPFCVVMGIASLPSVLFFKTMGTGAGIEGDFSWGIVVWAVAGWLAAVVLSTLSQAIVLYGAFEDMRGKPVNLIESLKVGLRRLFPIIGVAFSVAILGALACMLFLVPGFILFSMWFVAVPACIVERLGPSASMRRSSELTKGYRWRVFGLFFAMFMVNAIFGGVISGMTAAFGATMVIVLTLAWSAISGAFNAIMVVVSYHDLRVAKEGVDTDQIAAVFD